MKKLLIIFTGTMAVMATSSFAGMSDYMNKAKESMSKGSKSGSQATSSIPQSKAQEQWAMIHKQMEFMETESVEKYCGKRVPYEIDEASFGDYIYRNDVGPYECTQLLSAMASLCSQNKRQKEEILQGIKKVSCRYGGPLKNVPKEESMRGFEAAKVQQFSLKDGVLGWAMFYNPDTKYSEFGMDLSAHPYEIKIYQAAYEKLKL